MNLSQKIEAILFWKAEPVSLKNLAAFVEASLEDTNKAIIELEEQLKGRGITILRTDSEVSLGTSKDLCTLIEKLTKDELSRDIGKAGLETLSIILYEGPISRAEIDYIRGVNSQFILRTLLIRGLVERVENPKDQRSFLYKSTIDLLAHLGISKIEDIPEYDAVRRDINDFKHIRESDQTGITNAQTTA